MFRKYAFAVLKFALVAGIFVFLIARATRGAAFSELNLRSLGWGALALGVLFNFLGTTITIVRWRELVRALDAPFSLRDALRFGFIGFMFNLSPVGIVGGDAVKVVLAAKKTGVPADKATASVVLDRVIGLYAMFILGLVVVYSTGFGARPEPVAKLATQGLTGLTVALTIFLLFVVTPSSERGLRTRIAAKIPFVGGIVAKLTAATLLYQRRKTTLFLAFLSTFLVHACFAISLYFLARGVYGPAPSLVDHFILYCVGNVGSAIPLSAGPLEYFLDELYPLFEIAGRAPFEKGFGMTIGVFYRLATVVVALVGVVYYLLSKQGVQAALKSSNDAEN